GTQEWPTGSRSLCVYSSAQLALVTVADQEKLGTFFGAPELDAHPLKLRDRLVPVSVVELGFDCLPNGVISRGGYASIKPPIQQITSDLRSLVSFSDYAHSNAAGASSQRLMDVSLRGPAVATGSSFTCWPSANASRPLSAAGTAAAPTAGRA